MKSDAMSKPVTSRNPWPYAIIAYFLVFITGIIIWVNFAMRNDLELVREDYYDAEVRYQEQIDRLHRTAGIREDVRVAYDPGSRQIELRIPGEHAASGVTGQVRLYRPSDAALDRAVKLAVNHEGWQRIGLDGLRGGYWKVHLSWDHQGEEYFFEQAIVVPENPEEL